MSNLPLAVVIDDETDICEMLCEIAEEEGYRALSYTEAEQLENQVLRAAAMIFLDLRIPGCDGIEVLRLLSQIHCEAGIWIISGCDAGVLQSAETLAKEQGLNLQGSIAKPLRYRQLQKILQLTLKPNQPQSYVNRDIEFDRRDFEKALAAKEFIPFYQPQVSGKNLQLLGFEALVRWKHPEWGLVPPVRFISFAEENGLIADLSNLMFYATFNDYKRWQEAGISPSISINISGVEMDNLQLPEKLIEQMTLAGMPVQNLALELTESTLMEEMTKSLDIMTRLRMKGMHLSIDDFGTGYSSMVQLHRAPFTEIKIDRSFVMKLPGNSEATAIVEIITMLGHKLGMQVVAEGVETEEQVTFLRQIHCDKLQGYFFAKPQPLESALAWAKQHRQAVPC